MHKRTSSFSTCVSSSASFLLLFFLIFSFFEKKLFFKKHSEMFEENNKIILFEPLEENLHKKLSVVKSLRRTKIILQDITYNTLQASNTMFMPPWIWGIHPIKISHDPPPLPRVHNASRIKWDSPPGTFQKSLNLCYFKHVVERREVPFSKLIWGKTM